MKSLNLFKILFEEEVGTNSESNEDIIANIVLGKAVSTDPEEIEANKPISADFLKGSLTPLPEPDQEEIPFFGLEELNEAKLTPEERARREKEKAEKAALKAALAAERARLKASKDAEKASRTAARTAKEEEEKNRQDFFNAILANAVLYKETTDKDPKKFFRICPTEDFKKQLASKEITEQDFKDKLKNEKNSLFAGYNPKEIKPKEKGSGSGTFYTYELSGTINGKTTTISVVIAAGGNRGNDFEKEAFLEIFNKNGPVWDALMCFLVANEKITAMSDLVNVTNPGAGMKKRPFTNKMEDVGLIISDVTIERPHGQRPIYISLKDELGKTFANPGYGHVFSINKDKETGLYKVTFSTGNKKANPHIDKFLEIIGADKNKMAMGYEAYANGFAYAKGLVSSKPKLSQEIVAIPETQGDAALEFLTYQLGYGYIYFRRMPGGGYRIIDLDTPEKTKEIFGDFISGFMKYPYYIDHNKQNASRQFTVSIRTTTAHYYVEIRNTTELETPEGVVSGLQCNVKVEKTFAKPYACNIDWRQKLLDIEEDRMRLVQHNIDESFLLSNLLFRNKRNKF